mgnify:CR=1 FL=1
MCAPDGREVDEEEFLDGGGGGGAEEVEGGEDEGGSVGGAEELELAGDLCVVGARSSRSPRGDDGGVVEDRVGGDGTGGFAEVCLA